MTKTDVAALKGIVVVVVVVTNTGAGIEIAVAVESVEEIQVRIATEILAETENDIAEIDIEAAALKGKRIAAQTKLNTMITTNMTAIEDAVLIKSLTVVD